MSEETWPTCRVCGDTLKYDPYLAEYYCEACAEKWRRMNKTELDVGVGAS